MLVALAASLSSGVNAEAGSEARDGFTWQDCPYVVDGNWTVRCGRLRIFEPGPASLPVVVIQQDPERPSESAILYLAGGPGYSSGLDPDDFSIWTDWATNIGFEQDFVLFDQRGTGLAESSLHCPELREIVRPNLASGWHSERSVQRLTEAKSACHDRLIAEGHDLTQFTTEQLARDATTVMDALPYADWTVLGASYGSRVALEVIRNSPDGLRSVVLDGAIPTDSDMLLEEPELIDSSIAMIDHACLAWRLDPQFCEEQAGTFVTSLDSLLKDLAENPYWSVFDDGQDRPYKVRIEPADLLFALDGVSVDPIRATLARSAIVSAANGDFATLDIVLSHWAAALIRSELHEPIQFSVLCDSSSRWTTEEFRRRVARSNYYRAYVPYHRFVHPCDHWTESRADELIQEPVFSAIPTLVLSGKFDTRTPPAWGERVAAMLDSSYHFVMPESGHGTVFTDFCAIRILLGFLASPTAEPDSDCLESARPAASEPD